MDGFSTDYLGHIELIQGRLTQLLQAVPENDFNWRPAEGIRSLWVSPLPMHVALVSCPPGLPRSKNLRT
jgi:hypothetical protein